MMEGRDLYIRHDLGFPENFPPHRAGREDAENRLSINSQSFLPAPSCRDVASLPPSRPILTQRFEGKVGRSRYIAKKVQENTKKSLSFILDCGDF